MNQAELRRFHRGDRLLFRRLVEEESASLLRFATWLSGSSDEAEDLAQETWVAAYQQRHTFQGRSPLLSWLMAICRSRFLSKRRTVERRERLLEERASDLHGSSSSSHEVTGDPLARRLLAEALSELPERQRDVIIMRLVQDLSTSDCACRLGVAEGTIKSSLSRGLATLRPLLEDLQS